jgi:hypothetical protein
MIDRRALIALAPCVLLRPASAGRPAGKALYNARDLSGWHVQSGKLEAWSARGDRIICTGKEGGYLSTDEEYGDFELSLEYNISPGGNSGVGIRFPRGGWPSTDGMEIQILDDAHPKYRNLKPEHANASIYAHFGPAARPARPPGEWNQMTIRCQGPLIVIHVNRVEVQNVNLEDHPDSIGKGKLPLAKRPRRGLIGLQSHGDPVEFRNLYLREL